ncbi:hypothetical protein [Paenibacillus gallinarum]|uniref:Uncharacterized protein n=1 Tax=Paenibacillus gallinarum TaxID=2762232 RepID=A0ABR8T3E2_9BACL|nr:hypothetical protein [Paenibacillus gallinarum]MBD7970297.1 hypothetical protein [Paenibacillus gallinarum]
MKKFKKSSLITAAIVATMSLSSSSVFAADIVVPTTSVPESSNSVVAPPTIVDSSNSNVLPRTSYLVIDNANLNAGGNSWNQPSGFNHARLYVSNTSSKSLTITVSYKSGSGKVKLESYLISAKSSETVTIADASGHTFYVDYSTSDGTVSGKINVRVSDVEF